MGGDQERAPYHHLLHHHHHHHHHHHLLLLFLSLHRAAIIPERSQRDHLLQVTTRRPLLVCLVIIQGARRERDGTRELSRSFFFIVGGLSKHGRGVSAVEFGWEGKGTR